MAQDHNLALPSWATPLTQAISLPINHSANVVGFVTDVCVPKLTRTNEWMVTFNVCDHGFMLRQGDWQGMTVRFFKRNISEIPIPYVGDIVIIRNIKRSEFSGSPMLMSNWGTQTVIFRAESVPDSDQVAVPCICLPPGKLPIAEDQAYVVQLKKSCGQAVMSSLSPHVVLQTREALQRFVNQHSGDHGHEGRSPVTPGPQKQPSSPRTASSLTSHALNATKSYRKFSLIQDIQVDKFHDLVVEVVKIFSKYGDVADMHVTDYTENKELYDWPSPEEGAKEGGDGDTYGYIAPRNDGFPGPWGQRVLMVEVRQPHMAYLMESVNVGDFVNIRNVRIKNSRSGRLEGNMWVDRKFPDKIEMTKISRDGTDESRGVLERRRTYWSAREQPQQEKKMGKKEKKKRKRAEEKARAAEDSKTRKLDAMIASSGYVCTAHRDIPLTTLSALLEKRGQWRCEGKDEELPFVNQRRRCQLQAIDYYPPRLQDFARPKAQMKVDDFAGSDDDMDVDQQGWEWDFFLLVRDPILRASKTTAQTWLHVSNAAAQYLLKMDASNLNEDAASFNELGQKIDILCGNLRELKDQQLSEETGKADSATVMSKLSNLPFECCIEEYGWPKDDVEKATEGDNGWVRMFAMFETTIN